MEQIALYKDFRIRAYQEWRMVCRGQEAVDTDAQYIATPTGHRPPEAAIDFIEQMIDGPRTAG